MGTTQTQQISPMTESHGHQQQQMDLIGVLATMVIALVLYIYKRGNDKISEQLKQNNETQMRLYEETKASSNHAHDRITQHIIDSHSDKR